MITVLKANKTTRSELTDVKALDLPLIWERKIKQIIDENKLLYEPWIETAKDFNEIRTRFKERGFKNIPAGTSPLLDFKAYARAPIADTSSVKVRKTMLRKKKNG